MNVVWKRDCLDFFQSCTKNPARANGHPLSGRDAYLSCQSDAVLPSVTTDVWRVAGVGDRVTEQFETSRDPAACVQFTILRWTTLGF